jgi:BNR/Asp-box repeat.
MSFCVKEPYLFAGDGIKGAYRSSDNGASWTQVNQGISLNVSCVAVNGTKLYAGTLGGGIFVTNDDGMSWTALSTFSASYQGFQGYINGLVVTDSTIFISNGGSNNGNVLDGSVELSTDNGNSWTSVNSNLTNTCVWALAISGTKVFAGTEGAGIFCTTNYGTSWTLARAGLSNDTVWALAANDENIFAGTQDGLCVSIDSGSSWSKIDIQVKSGWKFKSIGALALRGDSLFASTDAGDYFSTDNGKNWTLMPRQANIRIQGLAATNSFLFAGTSSRVWKIPMSQINGAIASSQILPTNWSLKQNYPNPFNPGTTIRFGLPQRSRVRLSVFNLLGQQVAELANEELNAGEIEKTWNANVASGLYFYRIEAVSVGDPNERFVDVKKMILLK